MLTVVASLSMVVFLFYFNYQGLPGAPRQYYDISNWETVWQFGYLSKGFILALSILIFGLLIFIINLTAGVFKLFTGRKTNG